MSITSRVAQRFLSFKYDQKEKKQTKVDRIMRRIREETGISRGLAEEIADAVVRGREVGRLALQKGWPVEDGVIVGPNGDMSLDAVQGLNDKAASARLRMGPPQQDSRASGALKKAPLKAKSDGRTLNSAVLSAGYYAKKLNKTMYVYEGNSFMHLVFRVSDKEAEVLSPVNNTGERVLSVTPELDVFWHDVSRD